MTKLEMFKTAASAIVGVGTSKIVYAIIRNNVPTKTPVDKVTVAAGSFVIGGMAADATKKHTDKMIDELVDTYNKIKNQTNAN